MHSLTAGFAKQCRQAVEIARAAPLPKTPATPNHVVITGLGGSAAGGDLLSALYADQGRIPCLVNRDYTMPSFVGRESLVFATSYSGNTEETLSAYADAKKRGASIIVVSSGGEITARAKADGFPVVTVPGGQPPRTALGYMFMPLVVASEQLGLIPKQQYHEAFSAINMVAEQCGFKTLRDDNIAKKLAEVMSGKLTTLYGGGFWQYAIAQRWRGQINENAKEMVLTHVFPELCHNEILGWEGSGSQGVKEWVHVLLLGGNETARLNTRIEITFQLIGKTVKNQKLKFFKVEAEGDTTLAKMLSLAHFGDWLSLYLAALAGRDPGQMNAINRLKSRLSKID